MSLVEGVRLAERREQALFIGIEARMLQVHGGDEGAAAAAELRAAALADPETAALDECDDLDLDVSTVAGAELIEARERREAEEWWREIEAGDAEEHEP